MALLLLAALIVGGIAFVFVVRPFGFGLQGAPAAAGPGEIFLEPVAAIGPDPFTSSVATASASPAAPTASIAATATAAPTSTNPSSTVSAATTIQATAGGTVGLYGGTTNNAECDKNQLVSFLEQNADKGRAWAAVHGIEPAVIREFVAALTPVVLNQDTRVTNHGFRTGAADARQSVLQAGTAVLVDAFGVPRARCFCGNPLLEPIPSPVQPTYVGQAWPEFTTEKVSVIAPAPAPLAQIPVVDTLTGEVFGRPIGSDGTVDTALVVNPSATATDVFPPTDAPSEPPGPTSLPGPGAGEPVGREPFFPSDLTAIGAISANSVDPNFPASLAVDLDTTTSWFSIGPHTSSTVTEYTWSVDGPVEIEAVMIGGNEENATLAFRTGFGFEKVDVDLMMGGAVVSTMTQSLAGTPDPNVIVTFPAGIFGDTVRLRFTGHESLDCGGVSEVLVLGPDWEGDIERAIEEGFSLGE